MRTQVRSLSSEQSPVRVAERNFPIDSGLLFATIALILFGWIMITSASLDFANHRYGNAMHYFYRHTLYIAIAGFMAWAVFQIPVDVWKRFSWWLLMGSFALLMIIFLPGLGYSANGATRWLALGPLTLQVSEIAKIGVVIYLASYLVRQADLVKSHILGFINPMLVIMLLVVLLLVQPDFGAVIVLLSAALGMLFLGGVRLWQFGLLVAASLIAIVAMVLGEEYRMSRLIAFLDPWENQLGSGYQLVQSLIAFGRGEWFGIGLGNSIQKLFFLPEAHTDFIFAVLAEELGLAGCMVTLLVYVYFVVKILRVARGAEAVGKAFEAYTTYGIAIIFSVQLFINVGVNIGLLPTKGLTLPFLSYGGSSLLVSTFFVALVLRIDYEMRLLAKDESLRQGSAAKRKSFGQKGRSKSLDSERGFYA